MATVNQNNPGGQSIPSILPPVTELNPELDASSHQRESILPPYPPLPPPIIPPPPILPPYAGDEEIFALATDPKVLSPIDNCMRSVSFVLIGFPISLIGPFEIDILVNGVVYGSTTVPYINSGPTPVTPIEIPLNGCLRTSDSVTARMTNLRTGAITTSLTAVSVESHVKYSCLTQHYDNARTGWYPYERSLTPTNVGNITQKFELPVDGKPYAQPLYMHHVNFPGIGARNVIYLATENDTVYAYDADNPGPNKNGVLLWQKQLLRPGERAPWTQPPQGIGTDIYCGDITPTVGISSTPVIDCACAGICCKTGCCTDCGCDISGSPAKCCPQTMYVVSKSVSGAKNLKFHLYLHALDIVTGSERPNSPVEITGQVFGDGKGSVNGIITFDPKIQNVRPGLLLLNGCIYVASASHCDGGDYHGWVMSFDAKTLQRRAVFCSTPDGPDAKYDSPNNWPNDPNSGWGAGIWQAGQGLASDGKSIYFTTGNGGYPITHYDQQTKKTVVDAFFNSYNASVGGNNYGNSVLKLGADLKVQSFFTPADQWTLDFGDIDLGSGGIMILPPQLGPNPNQLVTLGKDGMIFLLDRDALGGFVGDAPHPALANGNFGANTNAVFTIGISGAAVPPTNTATYGLGIWGGPAYFHGLDTKGNEAQFVFYGRNGGSLTAFRLSSGTLSAIGASKNTYGLDGTTPVVTSNNKVAFGSEIVWAIDRAATDNNIRTVHLHAYALSDLISGNAASPKANLLIGNWQQGVPFLVPTIVNGKVYAACEDHIGVFF